MKTLTAEIEDSVLVRLQGLAKQERRPVAKVVRDALAGYLHKEEEDRLQALEQFLKPSRPASKRHLEQALEADYYAQ
ncbi:MAG: hypothetical protein NTY01_25755 [Verrucomicrobia bacterium]|nr:hypothetical protein [Verrucomicrobiota bacterium]